jgi:hypothetical protein
VSGEGQVLESRVADEIAVWREYRGVPAATVVDSLSEGIGTSLIRHSPNASATAPVGH